MNRFAVIVAFTSLCIVSSIVTLRATPQISTIGEGGQLESAAAATNLAGVFTYHNNNARTGLNSVESVLTLSNVNVHQFGRLRAPFLLDGEVHAQILYAAGLTVNGAAHNVIFAVTDHDTVYAFDANGRQPSSSQPWLWKVTCLTPHGSACTRGSPATNVSAVPCQDLVPFGLSCTVPNEIGIVSTPVIASRSSTMYFVTKTRETSSVNGGTNCLPISGTSQFYCYYFQLHAVNITNGNEKAGSPAVIQYPGSSTLPAFDAIRQHNRSALLLANGNVYVAFGSRGDLQPYYGWIFAYNSGTLAPATAAPFVTTPAPLTQGCPDGTQVEAAGGIWSVGAMAASSGHLYVSVGQGLFDGSSDFGDSFLRVNGTTLAVEDYFTPFNERTLACLDWDAGSGSPIVLPAGTGSATHPNLLMAGTKEGIETPTNDVQGRIYLMEANNMGNHGTTSDAVIAELIGSASQPYLLFNTPAYWNHLIFAGVTSGASSKTATPTSLLAFSISNATLSSAPVSRTSAQFIYPGGNPSVSSNGSTNGIVWALSRSRTDPVTAAQVPAMLHAFKGSNLSVELYNSSMNNADALGGDVTSFTTPTIANGKVYFTERYIPVSSLPPKSKLHLYGHLPTPR